VDFAIAPIGSDEVSSPDRIERLWEDAFVPILPSWIRQFAPAPQVPRRGLGGVSLNGDGLVFSACQPMDEGRGVLLRCFNTMDCAATGSWRLGEMPSLADVVRADCTVREKIPLEPGSRLVPIVVAPRAVHTVKLTFDD
jgi:hypothetical protein